jgi:outer membrane protein assembly factor BamA
LIKTNGYRYYGLFILLLTLILSSPAQNIKAQDQIKVDSLVIIGNITYEGNKITKPRIITRELMFSEGDTLSRKEFRLLLEKSRDNLLNTSLFNFVTATPTFSSGDPSITAVLFSFIERWYIWPWPIIEFADRNFNTWWTENRDLSRMSYGVAVRWDNFRGRKEVLEVTTKFGYNELYGFSYTIPYLNKKETLGLGLGAAFGRTKEVPVTNYDNKLVYFEGDEYVMKAVTSFVSLIYRREIYNTHKLALQYNYMIFADTLLVLNPNFSINGQDELQYLSLAYLFKSDHRDQKAYPLEGYYFDIEVVKRGLGLLDNGGLDVFFIQSTFRKYFRLSRRWYFASGLNSKFSNDATQPFYMDHAIGYGRDIVRGYEYYVVNGSNFGIFKNNFKFALLPQRDFNLNFIKSQKFSKGYYAFYLNAFLDFGFAENLIPQYELNNDLENALLIGYGLGIDFVTYYDLVFRFEYAINKMGEQGFYLHFTAPI